MEDPLEPTLALCFSLLYPCSEALAIVAITTTKTLICLGWETAVVPVSQPGTPVRDKRGCPFIPGLVTPTGTKGAAGAHVAGAPFCPGWCYQPGQNVLFPQSSFLFHLYSGFISNIISFQLH